MNTFHLRIVTMDGKVFDDQASQIFLRTIDGDVAIRAGHINYCSGIGMRSEEHTSELQSR